MINLIINADDFGYSRGVNHGIIDSHVYGIVNSTTMMLNMPGADHAIEMAKNHPQLRVGIHLVLTCGNPVTENVPSLVNENGEFKSLSHLRTDEVSLDELEKEWVAQIEKFLASDLKPTHFDSHHHVHTRQEFLPVVQKLSKTYNLPVRMNGQKALAGTTTFSDFSLLDFYGDNVAMEYFTKLPDRLEDGNTVEIMCHPAYLDHAILTGSSYNHQRLTELDILTAVKLPGYMSLL
jgi:chitin disaccharide deacetylase